MVLCHVVPQTLGDTNLIHVTLTHEAETGQEMLGIKVGGRSLASKFRRYVRPKTSDSTAALLNWAEYNGRAPNASAALGSIAKCSG